MRRLKVGISFDRWSEDGHHGTAHFSASEWLPMMSVLPGSGKSELARITRRLDHRSHLFNYAKNHDPVWQDPNVELTVAVPKRGAKVISREA